MRYSFVVFWAVGTSEGRMRYLMQTTQVTGSSSVTFNNGFVAAGAGADALFLINENLDASLGLVSLGELERSAITFVFQGMMGIRLRL